MTTTSTHPSTTESVRSVPVTAQGINGRITVDGDRVTLHKGLLTIRSGIRGQRLIPLNTIAGVTLQPATDQTDGRLQLVMRGADTSQQAHGDGEYTIRFHPASAPSFERVRAHLDALL